MVWVWLGLGVFLVVLWAGCLGLRPHPSTAPRVDRPKVGGYGKRNLPPEEGTRVRPSPPPPPKRNRCNCRFCRMLGGGQKN